jgi:hypothetical protein
MADKKRYQLGTRIASKEKRIVDSSGKPVNIVNKNNFKTLFEPSEVDAYIATKPPIPQEGIEFYKKKKEEGMTGDEIKQDIALQLFQKDIEDELYSKKDLLGKIAQNTGATIESTAIEIAAMIPHLVGFVANVATGDPIKQNIVGKAINDWTESKKDKAY